MSKINADYRQAALRRGLIVASNTKTPASPQVAMAASLEMANLGYLVEAEELEGMSETSLTSMVEDARTVMGADRDWTPIYPGFPKQVQELDTLTLLMEQLLHYWTHGAYLLNHPTEVRPGLPIKDMLKHARKVEVKSAAETARVLTRSLVTAPLALSDDDKTLLEGCQYLVKLSPAEAALIIAEAKNGENQQSLVKTLREVHGYDGSELIVAIAPKVKKSDHLLRLVLGAVAELAEEKWAANYARAVNNLSQKDARSLKMGKISRPARRAVVTRLGELSRGFNADSLVERRALWQRVMKAVHPYDLSLTEGQKRAVDIIHQNVNYRTLNSSIEAAMEEGDIVTAASLMEENAPGALLRRSVALLRLVTMEQEAKLLAAALSSVGGSMPLTTIISAFNGILSANDEHARVTRVAGLTNSMVDRSEVKKVDEKHLTLVLDGVREALKTALAAKDAPAGVVKVKSELPVSLVRRDASTTDRVMVRGSRLPLEGTGETLRLFGHWKNNQDFSGYMDIGVVLLDEDFKEIAVSTWNSWYDEREWSTYSGDKYVYPGDSAAEYFDVDLKKVEKKLPQARWATFTVQSWSGWPINEVDFIAGAMMRSGDGEEGEVFDARTVATSFKPTTTSTQAVPFAVDLSTMELVWVDSSNGSKAAGSSSTFDTTIGSIVYDEVARPRLTYGELASLWADAHGAVIVDEEAEVEVLDALLG